MIATARSILGMSKTNKTGGQNDKSDTKSSAVISVGDSVLTGNTFTFWNGDEYTGQFLTVKDKGKVVMEGFGTYKTADNEIYQGIWENDSLKEARRIIFSDNTEFTGDLDEMTIQGPGKYTFKGNVQIEGELVNNGFVGKVHLKDPTQHLWRGEVNTDDIFLKFHPLHSFWQSVLNKPLNVLLFTGETEEENEGMAHIF